MTLAVFVAWINQPLSVLLTFQPNCFKFGLKMSRFAKQKKSKKRERAKKVDLTPDFFTSFVFFLSGKILTSQSHKKSSSVKCARESYTYCTFHVRKALTKEGGVSVCQKLLFTLRNRFWFLFLFTFLHRIFSRESFAGLRLPQTQARLHPWSTGRRLNHVTGIRKGKEEEEEEEKERGEEILRWVLLRCMPKNIHHHHFKCTVTALSRALSTHHADQNNTRF